MEIVFFYKLCSSVVSCIFLDYPFITPKGFSLATFFEIPALWTTFTTSVTSLYASGNSSLKVSLPAARQYIPFSSNSLWVALPFVPFFAACLPRHLPAPWQVLPKVTKGRAIHRELEEKGIYCRAAGRETLREEFPEAYKDVTEVVNVVHNAGISKKVARLKPLGVIKG